MIISEKVDQLGINGALAITFHIAYGGIFLHSKNDLWIGIILG
jgi:hypothetical protein